MFVFCLSETQETEDKLTSEKVYSLSLLRFHVSEKKLCLEVLAGECRLVPRKQLQYSPLPSRWGRRQCSLSVMRGQDSLCALWFWYVWSQLSSASEWISSDEVQAATSSARAVRCKSTAQGEEEEEEKDNYQIIQQSGIVQAFLSGWIFRRMHICNINISFWTLFYRYSSCFGLTGSIRLQQLPQHAP